ncbi:MAG: hypothetical protein HQM13_12085 [SAR324 cluster bacterium]|nr:hypothetical protein [SAR324 cluster bacterium]
MRTNFKKYSCLIGLVLVPFAVFGNDTFDQLGDTITEAFNELTEAGRELSDEGKEIGEEILEEGKKLGKSWMKEGKKLGEELQEVTDEWLEKSKKSRRIKSEVKSLTNELMKIECSNNEECQEGKRKAVEKSVDEECGSLPLIFEMEERNENLECRKSSLMWKIRKAKLIHFFD